MKYRVKRCQWDGAVWPFATSIVLGGLANLLRRYNQNVIGRADYYDILRTYARSQHRVLPSGEEIPWICEDLHPDSGIWLARELILQGYLPGGTDMNHALIRGKDYNHSTFCDLVISGLVGLQLAADGTIDVDPLVPEDKWEWFCLDQVGFAGHSLCVRYDRTGSRYGGRPGLSVFVDGGEIGHSARLARLKGTIERFGETE
jgi:hypothetical protein